MTWLVIQLPVFGNEMEFLLQCREDGQLFLGTAFCVLKVAPATGNAFSLAIYWPRLPRSCLSLVAIRRDLPFFTLFLGGCPHVFDSSWEGMRVHAGKRTEPIRIGNIVAAICIANSNGPQMYCATAPFIIANTGSCQQVSKRVQPAPSSRPVR